MSELRTRAVGGITWSLAGQLAQTITAFVVGILLARLLSPREFGMMAMATVLFGFARVFADLGFTSSLIQKKNVTPSHLASVFWLNVFLGLVLTATFAIGAPLVAGFYSEPRLSLVTIALAPTFFIGSLGVLHGALLRKNLDFRSLAIVRVLSVVVAGLAAVVMAALGYGVWSLVAQSLVAMVVSTVAVWACARWRPSFLFDWQSVRELLPFSSNVLGNQTLNYVARNVDNLVIGRFLGSAALGVYSRAYAIMLLPLHNVTGVLSRVMFPAFSTIQDDTTRIAKAHLRVCAAVALVTFPLCIAVFVTADTFVGALFGRQWMPMVPVLRVLVLLGMTQSISALNGNLFLSQGRADLQFRLGLVLKANVVAGILIGLQWGVMGVAIGYATASCINLFPSVHFAAGLVGLTFWRVVAALRGVLLCVLTMGVSMWSLGSVIPRHWAGGLTLGLLWLAGMAIYVLLLHTFKVDAFRDVMSVVRRQPGSAAGDVPK